MIYPTINQLMVVLIMEILTLGMVHSQADSPCPDIFRYQHDDRAGLYGLVKISNPPSEMVQLNIEYSIESILEGYNGNIELANSSRMNLLNDLENHRPIYYKVFFPVWRGIPPKVTKILLNGEIICAGPNVAIGQVPVVTTVNLQHTLSVDIQTLGMTVKNNEFTFSPQLFKDNSNVVNHFNFKPQIPQNISSIYIGNPFLLSTSDRPETSPQNEYSTKSSKPQNPFFQPVAGDDYFKQRNPFFTNIGVTDPTSTSITSSPNFQQQLSSPKIQEIKPKVSSKTKSLENICGLPVNLNSLIYHGEMVPRGAYPWLAALFYVDSSGVSYKCGGSLISDRHIVTAAHCTFINSRKLLPQQLLVIMGKENLQKWTTSPEEMMIETESIIRHPDYASLKSDADIAVLVLSERVQFNPYVRPICLWSGNSELPNIIGHNGTVAGWGLDETGKIGTGGPKQIQLPIVSLDECILSSPNLVNAVSLRTFCAGSKNGSGPCTGDSGSGFVIYKNGRWMLRGVVSVAVSDPITHLCDLSHFVVFTDVSKHLDWLLNIIER